MLPKKDTIEIYHLPTTGTQDYPTSPSVTVRGCFLPLDRKDHALSGPVETTMYEVYVDGDVDIRESDKIKVDGVTYYAMHIFKANFGGLPHNRATLSEQP